MILITEYIETLLSGESLSFEKAEQLLDIVFGGEVSEVQIAAFLTAMRSKGVTAAELAGFAKSMRNHCLKVETGIENLVDIVGTGGAAVKTFNVSTVSAFVAAGAGVYIAKHGNRAITSKCGSADVLAELGVNIAPGPKVVAECIEKAHIGFMFAPMFHPAMKHVQPIRKGLGFRTVFNILGPLTNPAGAAALVLGVAEEGLMQMMAEALKVLGTRSAMVVHSNGLDEISTAGITKIVQLKEDKITTSELDPKDFGIELVSAEKLKATDAKSSAELARAILTGKDSGACRDIVILNAAAAIIAGGVAEDFKAAIKIADDSIKSGAAFACLEKLIETSNKV
ncbi:MAG: anthranilate phosphoribosyltransferase [Planctomycetes bacterium]|nr:anthranilate phosphoribosyltransferase [Planctomycetota bacterium]